MRLPERSRVGFSLIEIMVVLVLISLAVGALAPPALRQITAAKEKSTRERMERALRGLIGDAEVGDYGYLGDTGVLPSALADLNARGAQAAWSVDPTFGIGAGYRGPYAPELGDGFVDAWSTAFQYADTAAQLTSAGADRQFGSADDIIVPSLAPVITGNLSASVMGIPSGGGPPVALDQTQVAVSVISATAGVLVESSMSGNGPFTATNLGRGYHGLRASGLGSYAGVEARRVVVVAGGTTAVTLALEQP